MTTGIRVIVCNAHILFYMHLTLFSSFTKTDQPGQRKMILDSKVRQFFCMLLRRGFVGECNLCSVDWNKCLLKIIWVDMSVSWFTLLYSYKIHVYREYCICLIICTLRSIPKKKYRIFFVFPQLLQLSFCSLGSKVRPAHFRVNATGNTVRNESGRLLAFDFL